MTCPKCSTEHDPNRCQGHVIKDPTTRDPIPPRQCGKTPVKGSTVCRSHGAAKGTPAAARAQERVHDAAAEKALARLPIWNPDAAPVTNAVAGLQQLAGQLQHAVDALGSRIDGDLDQVTAAAWLRVVRELRTALSEMERLGIAERAVELEGARVRLVAHALGRVLEALGLPPEQRQEGVRLLLVELRSAPELPPAGGDGGEAA